MLPTLLAVAWLSFVAPISPAEPPGPDDLVRSLERQGVHDSAVLEALRKVPRALFVADDVRPLAYTDRPLPIEQGQSVSQPFVVARMTEAAAIGPGKRVLEVGTGSGYQAAVLSQLGAQVYTVEVRPELAVAARVRLNSLGYARVQVRIGDGALGWADAGPFDAILVTAATPTVPLALLDQLADGGRLIIPVGPVGGVQVLQVHQRDKNIVRAHDMFDVRFVPLVHRPLSMAPEVRRRAQAYAVETGASGVSSSGAKASVAAS
jgi:protein-L-isoaspartate(D-aspartate) O-methyltransferase